MLYAALSSLSFLARLAPSSGGGGSDAVHRGIQAVNYHIISKTLPFHLIYPFIVFM